MRLFDRRGLALLLAVTGQAIPAGAQLPAPPPAAAAPAPAATLPAATAGYEPAPLPSHPPDPATPVRSPAAGEKLAPGSLQMRITGSVTSYVGVGTDSGRSGK